VPDINANDGDTDILALKQALAERTRELRDLQEELARDGQMAMLGKLVATVAHELRSPLGAILTSLHLVEIRMPDADPGTAKALDRIRRSVRRSDEVITKLLDYSRYEPLAAEETRIDSWLRALFHAQTLPQGISLRFDSGFGDGSRMVDREKLHRALAHIIDNAAQALRESGKGGQICVASSNAGDSLAIRITDEGPGVPEEYRDRVFEPFVSGRRAGIGLGLPLARRIVEQHGGEISFASPPGGTTSFEIRLPP
jgi:two-component system sensor histidine kinase HydH